MNTHHNQPYLQNLSTQSLHMLSDTIIIGRHQDCNLVLKSEKGASRKHARITVQNGTAILMDLGSLNGTLVNGREISRAVQLSDGDIVIFDEQEYRFTGSATDSQSGSNNVTVIANKDEIGRPDRIKPAIRLVEASPASAVTNPGVSSEVSSLDETAAWDSLTSNLDQMQSADQVAAQAGEHDASQPDNMALQAQAANDQQQQEDLTQKPQELQEQGLQNQELHAHMSLAQGAQAQAPQAQESHVYGSPLQGSQAQGSPAQEESAAQGTQSPEPPEQQQHEWDPVTRPPRAQQQQQKPDVFERHSVEDEPQIDDFPAQEHQPMHQPANRRQPPQAAHGPAHQPRGQNSAPRAGRYYEQDRYESFPATSRPGGDERSTRPGLPKHNPYNVGPRKEINWTLWLIAIPLITLVALGAIYLAYTAGFSAGNAGSTSGFS